MNEQFEASTNDVWCFPCMWKIYENGQIATKLQLQICIALCVTESLEIYLSHIKTDA